MPLIERGMDSSGIRLKAKGHHLVAYTHFLVLEQAGLTQRLVAMK